jgi:hypothetical protein
MKKRLLSLMMVCCFALMGVAQAQNVLEISSQKVSDFATMVANDRDMSDIVVLTYVPDDMDSVIVIGAGMGFSWGVMFPSSMMSQYAGTQLVGVAFVDCGDAQFAGFYEARIYLGGDTQGENLVCQQDFQVEGVETSLMEIMLDTPVEIDGIQNLWVMFYQDGSVQSPAPAIDDLGDPNTRWIALDGIGWYDLAAMGYHFSWLAWAFLDGYDMIGENAEKVAVYPNPTSSKVTVQAKGMNHITVLNTLGQMVYDANVDGDLQNLDMSQYEAGVYMVRVTSENGTNVQRVVVK